jgi:hypothetical protein
MTLPTHKSLDVLPLHFSGYDGYTATVRDREGENEDQVYLCMQFAAMPPFFGRLFDGVPQVEHYMETTHAPQPVQWQPIAPHA